ncbi:MAG: hypothetical protein PHR39_02960 [Actinomycetota bacterium]|nr:hypothetical protein [Actinomycetota bacterium]
MKSDEHYFKIDRKILELNKESLSKKALILYILYCRSVNPRKNMGCSFLGYNGCSDYLKNKEAFLMAKTELMQKKLIQERPDVKTGILKTLAVEVLNFPLFGKEDNDFKMNNCYGHNHRTYRKDIKQYINISSEIINRGYLKDFSINDIYGLIFLYSKLDYKNSLGIDFNVVHAYDSKNIKGFKFYSTFGAGFSRDIYKKNCVKVTNPDKYFIGKVVFIFNICEIVNRFIKLGLFEMIPVLIKTDEEDADICCITEEIYKGNVEYENDKKCKDLFLFEEPENNQKVIWILRPVYPVITKEYELFIEVRDKRKNYEYNRYHYFDISTSKKSKIEIINDEDFESFLNDWKPYLYSKVEKYFIQGLNENSIENIIDILPDYTYIVYERIFKDSL